MLLTGMRLGRYELVAPLGAGGMGEVYRAKDTRLGREVAIKILPEQFAQDTKRVERFEREAKAVAALSHPNILAIYDCGTAEGVSFAVMELLEGETFRERLRRSAVPWREAVELGVAVADGLAASHAKGIVHRDVKPENLFVTQTGHVKILDYGLARVESSASHPGDRTGSYHPIPTDAGTVVGTATYMSPEQVRGQSVDGRSDIFSLGGVLYEMVAARPPFAGGSHAEIMVAILHEQPPAFDDAQAAVPVEVKRTICRCLEKDPAARFQSAADLAFALRAALTPADRYPQPPATARPWTVLRVAVVTLLGVVCAALLLFLFRDGSAPGPSQPANAGKPMTAVAVLPFENVGGNPEAEYLSSGIPNNLCNSLARVRIGGLKVTPFTSVSRYRSGNVDVKSVGQDLGVTRVVAGKVALVGEQLSVSVEVIDASDGQLLWGDQYSEDQASILDLQDTVARDVIARLGQELTGEQGQRLTQRDTNNAEAYLLYREGRYRLAKMVPDDLQAASALFQQAIDKDPKYALAYCGLADCYIALGTFFIEPTKAFPDAKRALVQALKLNESLAEAHVALSGVQLFYDWNWPAAEREFQQALKLNPNLPDAYQASGNYLLVMGRHQEAIRQFQRAEELDSLSPVRSSDLSWACILAGKYDEAVRHARRSLEIDPGYYHAFCNLGSALTELKLYAEAEEQYRKSLAMVKDNPCPLALLGYNFARWRKPMDALEAVEDLQNLKNWRYVSGIELAIVYSALEEPEQAFQWLRRAVDEKFSWLVFLKSDPTLVELRADPRFAELVRAVGLP